jgi:outer membrane lipoprotein SlyB
MRRKDRWPSRGLVILVVLVCVAVISGGCETIERSLKGNPNTAVGAGVGGAGGALVGGLAGATRGAIIGGLAGGLAGGVIGNLLDRRERTRQATAMNEAYTQDQGNLVRIEEVGINPQSIHPGETVNINIRYAIITPQGTAPARVREVRQIYHQGQLVGNPVVEIDRPDGTYWSTLPITLPATAELGRYDVVVGVEMNGSVDRWESRFAVTQQ